LDRKVFIFNRRTAEQGTAAYRIENTFFFFKGITSSKFLVQPARNAFGHIRHSATMLMLVEQFFGHT
jgi:hypothetical protein